MEPNTEAKGLLTPMELYIPDGLLMSNWSPQHAVRTQLCFETLSAFFLEPAAYPLTVFETSNALRLLFAGAPIDCVPSVDTKEIR